MTVKDEELLVVVVVAAAAKKLPSERKAFLKRRQRERSVDQDLAPCAAACHPNVRRYWVSTDHVDDHARQ